MGDRTVVSCEILGGAACCRENGNCAMMTDKTGIPRAHTCRDAYDFIAQALKPYFENNNFRLTTIAPDLVIGKATPSNVEREHIVAIRRGKVTSSIPSIR